MPLPNFTDGGVLTAADLNSVADTVDTVAADINTLKTTGFGSTQTYTPAHYNLTVGNGTQIARYQRLSATLCWVHFRFTFGTTSSIGSSAQVGLPFTSANNGAVQWLPGMYFDVGGSPARHMAGVSINANGAYGILISGTGAGTATATAPFTWVSGDQITIEGIYETA